MSGQKNKNTNTNKQNINKLANKQTTNKQMKTENKNKLRLKPPPKKTPHTIRTVLISNWNIVETKSIAITHIYLTTNSPGLVHALQQKVVWIN